MPRNTHSWEKYVKPREILELAEKENIKLDKISGLFPLPNLKGFNWIRVKSTKVNYIVSLKN